MPKPHHQSTEALVEHALATLPDSFTGRRRLLIACQMSLPLNDPMRHHCKNLLALMDEMDALQIKLSYERAEGGAR